MVESGMTYHCQYDARTGSGGGCPNERTLDFEFCTHHLMTPRGRQHVMDTISQGSLTLPSQVEAAINQATAIPETDYQTTSLEKMAEALDTIVDWKDEARRNLDRLGGSDKWRYTDRAGQEQQRTELGVYERALDRLSRHLGTMGKQALNDRLVTLGKAQVDMMIRLMMSVITELRLPNAETDKARLILLEKLRDEANLTQRVEKHAEDVLVIESSPIPTGGVNSVAIRGERVAG